MHKIVRDCRKIRQSTAKTIASLYDLLQRIKTNTKLKTFKTNNKLCLFLLQVLFITTIYYACASKRHDNKHLHILRWEIPT